MKVVEVVQGSSPIVLGLPHTGTMVPAPILAKLNAVGKSLRDTDWHIEQLYDGLLENVTTVRALFHRYVIDANRDPSGSSLYPGQNTTDLVPLTDFDGEPLWIEAPTEADVQQRLETFHAPYHQALKKELERVHSLHGCVILYDCHSIRSEIPFLFEGTLPDFNIGTNVGKTCAAIIEQEVTARCQQAAGFTTVVNGRFKGGWTTREYGQPMLHRHAVQMELAQKNYLASESPPFNYDIDKADRIRAVLKSVLLRLEELVEQRIIPSRS